MKQPIRRILLWGTALLPVLVVLCTYHLLPEQIPQNWDFNGTVTYGERWMILPLSAMGVLFTVLAPLLQHIDPKRENYSRFAPTYHLFFIILNLFILCMTLLVIIESLRPGTLQVQTFVLVLVGIFITVCGNVMPKFKHNYFIGVKTPWTLASETVWYRTHRLCGGLWVIGGLILIVCAFLPSKLVFPAFLIDLFTISIIPCIASYLFFKKEQ